MLTLPQFVVNRFPSAKFLSYTNAQGVGFAAGGDVSGKSQSGEFPRRENRKIASLTPVSVSNYMLAETTRSEPLARGQACDFAIPDHPRLLRALSSA
jgi:hypothetical protein